MRLSLVMLDLRLVLIRFRALKDLSDEHEVTGKVQSIRNIILMLTKYDEQRGKVKPRVCGSA